jgi:quercetin dioxygenase-like cupin family protein
MKLIAQAHQEAPFQVKEGMQRKLLTYVVSGEIDYCVEGEEPVRLIAGGSFYVPPNVSHRVVAYSRSLLIDAFTPMRDEFINP